MFLDTITTTDGTFKAFRCFICGCMSDTVIEVNRKNPPPPPERRGRKPNHLIREIRRKPVVRRKITV